MDDSSWCLLAPLCTSLRRALLHLKPLSVLAHPSSDEIKPGATTQQALQRLHHAHQAHAPRMRRCPKSWALATPWHIITPLSPLPACSQTRSALSLVLDAACKTNQIPNRLPMPSRYQRSYWHSCDIANQPFAPVENAPHSSLSHTLQHMPLTPQASAIEHLCPCHL